MKIAIAGAGIGGLAVACLLAQAGHEIVLFDQFAAPRPVGSGLVIQPLGLAVLDMCGAGAAVRAQGQRIARMLGLDVRRGQRILDVVYDKAGQETAQGLGIHRAALHGALLQAAAGLGVAVTPLSQVTAAPREAGQRRLIMADGAVHGPYDLAIDATGSGSALSPMLARPLPYGAIWGTVAWPEGTDLPISHLSQRYHGASRMAGVLPVGQLPGRQGPHAAIFWSMPRRDLAVWGQRPLTEWQAEAAAHWPEFARFAAHITASAHLTPATYSHGSLARPFAPALAYIGDAAHRASPQLGQGANMALFDALALARALARAPVDEALPAYAQMRRWHVRIYQAMSAAFTPQYQSDSRALPALRDFILAPASLTPPVPQLIARIVAGTLVPPLAGEVFTTR